jgi:short-subunit dehydrogenase
MSTLREVSLDIGFLIARVYSDLFSLTLALGIRLPIAIGRWLTSWIIQPAYKNRQFKSVFITGASAGLGAALAVTFARPGVIVTITARSVDSLAATKEACEKKGATCVAKAMDVRDSDAMKELIREAHAKRRLDLVIANAGCTAQDNGIEEAATVIDINAVGTANTIMPALDLMLREQKDPQYNPQLVLMSSLGGFIAGGSFFIAPYVASKNCVRALGESLRTVVKGRIGVSVIFPGMTESRMVSQQRKKGIRMMTGVWPIEQAIALMEDGIRNNSAEIVYPFAYYILARVYGTTISWMKDLYAPITRTVGDPYAMCDQGIWRNAKLYT